MADTTTKSSRLDALLKQQKQIAAKITEAQRKEKGKSRKDETREKILVGAAVLADVERNQEIRGGIVDVLKRGITTGRDKDFLKARGWNL